MNSAICFPMSKYSLLFHRQKQERNVPPQAWISAQWNVLWIFSTLNQKLFPIKIHLSSSHNSPVLLPEADSSLFAQANIQGFICTTHRPTGICFSTLSKTKVLEHTSPLSQKKSSFWVCLPLYSSLSSPEKTSWRELVLSRIENQTLIKQHKVSHDFLQENSCYSVKFDFLWWHFTNFLCFCVYILCSNVYIWNGSVQDTKRILGNVTLKGKGEY